MKEEKTNNSENLALSGRLIKNLKYLIQKSGMTQLEISTLAKIPKATLNDIILGSTINPKLHTLATIARVFRINIAQLIGEIPLNFSETVIPILNWQDIDTQKKVVNSSVDENTVFTSSSLITENQVFALRIDNRLFSNYKANSIIIVEATDKFVNNGLVVLSVNNSEPTIKKVIIEGGEVFFESVTHKLPVMQYKPDSTHIFGVIRETRIYTYHQTIL